MSNDIENDSDDDFTSNYVIVPLPGNHSSVEGEPLGDDHSSVGFETHEDDHPPDANLMGRQVFDEDLPLSHSYLGELNRVRGRTVLPDNTIVALPLLPGESGTWLPGQTFPLIVRDHIRSQIFREAVSGDHTFGCRARGLNTNYGTTCEIYEFSDSNGQVSIKAKVRQRFKKLNMKTGPVPAYFSVCQILPERVLRKPLANFYLPSLDRIRNKVPRRCQLREAYCSPWPVWVHRQYDTDYLRKKIAGELLFLKQGLKKINDRTPMPENPTDLSFWLGTHLGSDERLFLIKENSPVRRLRWMLSLMMQCLKYFCFSCDVLIGHQRDFFAMSAEGASGTYVNPAGYVHDTITLKKASNLVLISNPSTEYSWFPGYAWQIAACWHCQKHIGWKFTSKKFVPKTFWGLTRQSLHTGLAWDPNKSEEPLVPIM